MTLLNWKELGERKEEEEEGDSKINFSFSRYQTNLIPPRVVTPPSFSSPVVQPRGEFFAAEELRILNPPPFFLTAILLPFSPCLLALSVCSGNRCEN